MKSKYALRALTIMASDPQANWQAKSIAEAGDIPLKFLESILRELRSHGFINSKRGITGGHSLAKAAKDIGIGNVIRVFDKMIAPIPCASAFSYKPCDECLNPKTCDIRHLMIDVRNAMSDVLDKNTIQDLCDYNAPRRKK